MLFRNTSAKDEVVAPQNGGHGEPICDEAEFPEKLYVMRLTWDIPYGACLKEQ